MSEPVQYGTLIPAIDFNYAMTILSLMQNVASGLPSIWKSLETDDIEIIIGYPEDYTSFSKPAIILQKMHSKSAGIGMGNYIGESYNEIDQSYTDVYGVSWNMMYQFEVVGRSHQEVSILNALVMDEFLTKYKLNENGDIPLYDFTADILNPTICGTIQLMDDVNGITYASNDNKDYAASMNFETYTIQTTIPAQEYVDLGKDIKVVYHLTNTN